jgi:hypothetical protein
VVSFLLVFPPVSYMHSSSPHSCYISCPSHRTKIKFISPAKSVPKKLPFRLFNSSVRTVIFMKILSRVGGYAWRITDSRPDDWIYWHFGYNFS